MHAWQEERPQCTRAGDTTLCQGTTHRCEDGGGCSKCVNIPLTGVTRQLCDHPMPAARKRTCRTRRPSTVVHSHTTCTSKLLPAGQSRDSSSAATKREQVLSTGTATALLLHCMGPPPLLLVPDKPTTVASAPAGVPLLPLPPAAAASLAATPSATLPAAAAAAAAALPGVSSVTGSCGVPDTYAAGGRRSPSAKGPLRLTSLTPAGSCMSSAPSQPNLLCATAAMLAASGGCSSCWSSSRPWLASTASCSSRAAGADVLPVMTSVCVSVFVVGC